jgi:hypothetical protein
MWCWKKEIQSGLVEIEVVQLGIEDLPSWFIVGCN